MKGCNCISRYIAKRRLKRAVVLLRERLSECEAVEEQTEKSIAALHVDIRRTLVGMRLDTNHVILRNRIESLVKDSKVQERRLHKNNQLCHTLKHHIRLLEVRPLEWVVSISGCHRTRNNWIILCPP